MKRTLLDLTQSILSDLNDDEVNSISDTTESLQVASIIKDVYYEMMANKNWPHLRQLNSLDALADTAKPTHMRVPDNVKELEWIQYNKRKVTAPTRNVYEDVKHLTPDEFLRRTSSYDNTQDNVLVVEDFSGVVLHIKDDRHPQVWTSFDDDYVIFDSYDSDLDDTLQETHTRASVFITPAWSVTDTFIPDLPEEQFPALLAEAKSVAFVDIKQSPNPKAEQQSTRQRSWASRKAWRISGGIQLPNYARRSRK